MRLRHRYLVRIRHSITKNVAELACGVRVMVAAPVPRQTTRLVVRDGIDSGWSIRVSEMLTVPNREEPNTRQPQTRRSSPYWMACVVGPARRAGEGQARFSTRGALESVTGLVHIIMTATVPSAKTPFRPCEQRRFGPPAGVPSTGTQGSARASRDAPRRRPAGSERVYCCST